MFTFQFLNDKIHNCVKKRDDCEFHQKLKSKHTSLKKIYKLSKNSHFEGRRGEKKYTTFYGCFQIFDLDYSPLNSAKVRCSSEVTLDSRGDKNGFGLVFQTKPQKR